MIEPAQHTLETIWGHDAVKDRLGEALAGGRLPPVMLFEGRDGIGKRSMALAAAKLILSAARSEAAQSTREVAVEKPARAPVPHEFIPASDEGDLFGAESEAAPSAPLSTPRTPHPTRDTRAPGPRPQDLHLDAAVCRRVEASYPPKFDSDGRATTLGHPDLTILEPPGQSRSILVGQVEAMQEFVARPPIQGAWRLAIVLGVDAITPLAANSMLKLLEEPPAWLRFILVTDQPGRVLATIRSRSVRMAFYPMPPAELTRRLVESEKLAREMAGAVAALSEGRPGVALTLIASGLINRRRELFEARLAVERLGPAAITGAAARALAGAGKYDDAVRMLMSFLRDRLVRRYAPDHPGLLVNGDMTELLDAGRASGAVLDEEIDRLVEALASAEHPFVPNSQAALELAMWP